MYLFKKLMLSSSRYRIKLCGNPQSFLRHSARYCEAKPRFNESRFNPSPFWTAGSALVFSGVGVFFGVYTTDRYLLKQYGQQQDININNNKTFEKFIKHHHIPHYVGEYFIPRPSVADALKHDIVACAASEKVVNIVGEKSLGKSTMLVEAARAIEKEYGSKYKVFYVNGDQTLRQYLKTNYDLIYQDDRSAVSDLMTYITKYSMSKPKGQMVIVIIDSPGGIQENEDPIDGPETNENASTRMAMVKGLKELVAVGYATVYCLSTPPNKLFSAKRKAKLGTARYVESEQKDWIDFELCGEEMKSLMEQFESVNDVKFTEKEASKIMVNKSKMIGEFIMEMSKVVRKRTN